MTKALKGITKIEIMKRKLNLSLISWDLSNYFTNLSFETNFSQKQKIMEIKRFSERLTDLTDFRAQRLYIKRDPGLEWSRCHTRWLNAHNSGLIWVSSHRCWPRTTMWPTLVSLPLCHLSDASGGTHVSGVGLPFRQFSDSADLNDLRLANCRLEWIPTLWFGRNLFIILIECSQHWIIRVTLLVGVGHYPSLHNSSQRYPTPGPCAGGRDRQPLYIASRIFWLIGETYSDNESEYLCDKCSKIALNKIFVIQIRNSCITGNLVKKENQLFVWEKIKLMGKENSNLISVNSLEQ